MAFKWKRFGGYECSSQGDPRFSAFNAKMPDGRTIEQHYQCDVKGYQPGGTNWRLGKGKPALVNPDRDLWPEYLGLWQTWAQHNPDAMRELRTLAAQHDYLLSDRFASSPINQARALSELLNEADRLSQPELPMMQP
jgi:hypothetical protein